MRRTESEWMAAMKAKGHTPRMNEDGTLDHFWSGHCDGPVCEACYDSWCVNCCDIGDIEECDNAALELTAVRISGKITG